MPVTRREGVHQKEDRLHNPVGGAAPVTRGKLGFFIACSL